jgi:hypothetical protein
MLTEMQQFLADREAALRSLDKPTILAYFRRWGETAMADRAERAADDTTFWAGIHRARLSLACFTEDEQRISREWLVAHGFQPRPY